MSGRDRTVEFARERSPPLAAASWDAHPPAQARTRSSRVAKTIRSKISALAILLHLARIERRQQTRQRLRQHGFARAWRTDHQEDEPAAFRDIRFVRFARIANGETQSA
jgi:hypothetical protein